MTGQRRRWLRALDPVMEGGRHRKHARAWDAGDEPIAAALLGDMTIGLSQIKSAPARLASAITRAPTSRCPRLRQFSAQRHHQRSQHVRWRRGLISGHMPGLRVKIIRHTPPRSPARRPNPASAVALRPDWSSLPVTRPWRECAGAVFQPWSWLAGFVKVDKVQAGRGVHATGHGRRVEAQV
jgi:hypothetical protein